MTNFILISPLEQFEIIPLIIITAPIIGNFVLALTNLGLYIILTVILVIGLHILGNNIHRLIPNRWSVSIESIYVTITNIVRDQIGNTHEIYVPFIYTLFWILLIINLNGNIPYSYTVTTSIIAALGLSIFVFIAVTILGLSIHKTSFFLIFCSFWYTSSSSSTTCPYWTY